VSTAAKLELQGSIEPGFDEVVTPDALEFVSELESRFGPRRRELLEARARRRARLKEGELLGFRDDTRELRESDWRVDPVPADLQQRWVEIIGPTDRKMTTNALNSGADGFMADFEDATSPTWSNMVQGQINLRDAIDRTITYDGSDGRHYELVERPATLLVRPRGWHLPERHLLLDSEPVSGALFDFGLYVFHCAPRLRAGGSGPYFYLPKLESHPEARLWNDVFCCAQELLGIPRGTWDYIFSAIKCFPDRPEMVLPDRACVTMTVPFMRAYTELLVATCDRRGAHAMGGMAALIPSRRDEDANERALEGVRADKRREVGRGYDGTWVAHPDLVPVAREVFSSGLSGAANQLGRRRDDVDVTAGELLDLASTPGEITEQGLRTNVSVGFQYISFWLAGRGAAAINSLMEDAATAEICRSQVWQWIHHRARLRDGREVTTELVSDLLDEEMAAIRERVGEDIWHAGRPVQTREIFERVALSDELLEFLTLPAYEYLD
jgi:malate synthase